MDAAHHRLQAKKSIVTIGMQDKSELLLRELDDDFFGAQDDSDASVAAAFFNLSYESQEPSSDEDVPAAWRVDRGASPVHSRAWEQ